MTLGPLHEHFFRHEYGKLVATLTRRFGAGRLVDVEDAVHSALLKALEIWPVSGVPGNPQGWLFRVAYNELLGELRQRLRRDRIREQTASIFTSIASDATDSQACENFHADLLHMLFACCDESIPPESQLVFALKTLCGFSIPEIALRLFATEANVYKRLTRARNRLKALGRTFGEVQFEPTRLVAVQRVLYVMFTEGYLSSNEESSLRRDLCDEAISLTSLLADAPSVRTPETYALLALMHLHSARMTARADGVGGLVLLQDQDRSLWDAEQIELGMKYLAQSAEGDRFSRYHAEAAIAVEHCLAPSFAETRWDRIIECYDILEHVAPSAVNTLNRAIAVAQLKGPTEGLAVLEGFSPPTWLTSSYLWSAVLADLHRRCDNLDAAQRFAEIACTSAPSSAIKMLLERRFALCESEVVRTLQR